MSLDLTIREQHNISEDEKGRTTWQVTCLGNFYNCWTFLQHIQNRTDLYNCTTVGLDGDQIQEILDDMQFEADENDSSDIRKELEYVKQVIEDGEIQLDNEHSYEINAWW